ncbi:MAG: hypothetical protein WA948_13090 [Pontixanthobacter sp.]
MSDDAESPTQSEVAELPPLTTLALMGAFAEQVTIAPRSFSTMLLATGFDEDNERSVLVPFIETVIHGTTQGEAVAHQGDTDGPPELAPIFSRTLPLENALWLAFDLIRDIRVAAENMSSMVEGSIDLERSRLEHARRFASFAGEEAKRCEEALERLSQGRTTAVHDAE